MCNSLQNFFVECNPSEKLIQLLRIITYEREHSGSAKFIVYFATCACVDYFYRVRDAPARSPIPLQNSPRSSLLSYPLATLYTLYMATFPPPPGHQHWPPSLLTPPLLPSPLSCSALTSPRAGSIFLPWMSWSSSTRLLTRRVSLIGVGVPRGRGERDVRGVSLERRRKDTLVSHVLPYILALFVKQCINRFLSCSQNTPQGTSLSSRRN